MTHALVVNNTEPEDYIIVFMMPRNDDILILGTFSEFDRWETDLTPDTPIMRKMREVGACLEACSAGIRTIQLRKDYDPSGSAILELKREPGMNGSSQSRNHSYL